MSKVVEKDENQSLSSISPFGGMSSLSPQLIMQLNGKVLSSSSDLDKFPKEELFVILQTLFLENCQLKSTVAQLSTNLSEKILEINRLNQQLNDVEEIKKEILNLEAENRELREKLKFLEQENDSLKGDISSIRTDLIAIKHENDSLKIRLDTVQFKLETREIGIRADTNVMNYIFPNCSKKPFRIRSYKNLMKFLEDPDVAVKNDLCDEKASDSFRRLSEENRSRIMARANLIKEKFPELKDYISDLKDDHTSAHPSCNNIDELLNHWKNQNEQEIIDALNVCFPLIDKSYFSNLTTASDVDENAW